MFVAFRALTYATLFVGFLLIYLPARVLAWSGIVRPAAMEWPEIAGLAMARLARRWRCGACRRLW